MKSLYITSGHRVSSICTWFYVAAQMIQRVNSFVVSLLIRVVRVELRPP